MLKLKMLTNKGEKYSRCPCCNGCKDCSIFKNNLDNQGAGLLFNQQIPKNQVNKVTEPVKDAVADDVFTLQNIKDTKNTMSCHISTQELQNIYCPRCKYIIDRATKRIQAKELNHKDAVIGVCDHCRNKIITKLSFYECEDITKKIVSSISGESDDSWLNLKTWLANDKHSLNSSMINKERADRNVQNVAPPQLYLNKLHKKLDKFDLGEHPQIKMKLNPRTYEPDSENISKPKLEIKRIYRARSIDSYLHRLENVSNIKSTTLKSGKQHGPKLYGIISPGGKPDKRSLDMLDIDTHHRPGKRFITSSSLCDYDSLYPCDKKYLPKPDHRTLLDMQNSYYQEDRKFGSKPESRPRTVMEGYDSRDWQYKRYLSAPVNNYNKQSQKSRLEKYIEKLEKNGAIKDNTSKATKSVKVTLADTSDLITSLHQVRSETSILDLGKVSLSKGVFKSVTDLYSRRKRESGSLKSHDYIEHLVSSTMPRIKTRKNTKDLDIKSVYYPPNKKDPSEDALSPRILPQSETLLRKDFSYQFPKEIISKKESKQLPTSAELIKETEDMLKVREEKKQTIEIERVRKLLEGEIKSKTREEKRRHQKEKREEEVRKRINENRIKPEENTKVKLSEEEKQKAKDDKEKAKVEWDRTKVGRGKKGEDENRRAKEESRDKSKPENKDHEQADKEADKLKKHKENEIQLRKQKEEKQREKDEKERLKKEKEEHLKAKKDQKQGKKEEEKSKKNKQLAAQKAKNYEEISNHKSKRPKSESPRDQSKQKNKQPVEDLKNIYKQTNNKDEAMKSEKEAQFKKTARGEADNKEIEKLQKVHDIFSKAVINPEPEQEVNKNNKKNESPTLKELDIKEIKVRKPSYDDLILKLVRLKQSGPRERVKQKQLPVLDIPLVAREHKTHKYTKASKCLMCVDSEFELYVEEVLMKTNPPNKPADIIIGQKILKYKPLFAVKEEKAITVPSILQSTFQIDSPNVINEEPDIVLSQEPEQKSLKISVPAKSQKLMEVKL